MAADVTGNYVEGIKYDYEKSYDSYKMEKFLMRTGADLHQALKDGEYQSKGFEAFENHVVNYLIIPSLTDKEFKKLIKEMDKFIEYLQKGKLYKVYDTKMYSKYLSTRVRFSEGVESSMFESDFFFNDEPYQFTNINNGKYIEDDWD